MRKNHLMSLLLLASVVTTLVSCQKGKDNNNPDEVVYSIENTWKVANVPNDQGIPFMILSVNKLIGGSVLIGAPFCTADTILTTTNFDSVLYHSQSLCTTENIIYSNKQQSAGIVCFYACDTLQKDTLRDTIYFSGLDGKRPMVKISSISSTDSFQMVKYTGKGILIEQPYTPSILEVTLSPSGAIEGHCFVLTDVANELSGKLYFEYSPLSSMLGKQTLDILPTGVVFKCNMPIQTSISALVGTFYYRLHLVVKQGTLTFHSYSDIKSVTF